MRAFDLEVAARAAIAGVVPLAVLVALGHVELAPYAAFGSMTAIFGRGEAYRGRIRTVTVAGVALVLSIGIGIGAAVGGGTVPLVAVALVIVLVAGVLTVNIARLGPPSPLFFVFAVLVCASVPTEPDEVALRLGIAVAAAAFAWLISMSGWLLRRVARRRETSASMFKPLRTHAPIRWAALRDAAVWRTIAQHVIAGLLAGAIALALGIGHPYWAVVSVAAVIPPAGAAHSISRAWHRVAGTVVGVVVTGLILWPDPPVWVLVIVVAVTQFGAEVFVGRHYGVALVFITPLALVVAHLAQPVEVGTLLVDRVVETALGCGIAILAVLTARGLTRRA